MRACRFQWQFYIYIYLLQTLRTHYIDQRLSQLECCENVSISVINREGAAWPCFVFVFQESLRANPFNFAQFPPDKAHAQDLPGNLHTIKATASAYRMMVAFRFDVIGWHRGHRRFNHLNYPRQCIIFRPILHCLPENAALIVWNKRKVKR